ncbi:MAG: thiamine pyrophosphate-binding protein, partial [Gammaproteobacteria bacterium]
VLGALECIASAERPVIVAGGGVRASGGADALVRFAEAAGVPVATSLTAKDCMPGLHPLNAGVPGTYSRKSANRVVHEADLVVFIGTSAGSMTTHFWTLPAPGTRAVQIDIDGATLGRNYPLEVAIQADARTTLERMLGGLATVAPRRRNAWLERVNVLCAEWRGEAQPLLDSEGSPIRPERLCAELTRLVPDDAIVIADTGHGGMWMGAQFDLRSAGQSYLRSAGHLGWAFPAGLGAKCACPDRPVVTFTGDLGLWYHIGEIETAVRRGINAVTVVNNNRSGNQSTRGFARAYAGEPTEKSRELWVHNEVNFARIAGEIGALGIRVTRASEIGDALARAFEADRPVIVDVVTDIEAIAPLAWPA